MRDDRYSLVMGRVLVVLALGILASLFVPLTCWGQSLPSDTIRSVTSVKPDGTQVSPRLLAIPVAAVFGASVYAIHADKQWHHEYIGAALLLSNRRWVQWAGLAIMVDDAAQHLIQTRHPKYLSPLHQAYAVTLYRWFR